MWKVDIYLENAGKSVKRKKGWIWIRSGLSGISGSTRLEGFRETEDTKNERDVRMLLEVLSRCKPCEAVIHTESQYLQGMFGRLSHYRENGWKKSDGTEIKYKELWQQVSDAAVGKEVTFRTGTHDFPDGCKERYSTRRKTKMYEKFGEFDSWEEINKAARAQLEEGDLDAIKEIAKENGLDPEEWRTFAPVQSKN